MPRILNRSSSSSSASSSLYWKSEKSKKSISTSSSSSLSSTLLTSPLPSSSSSASISLTLLLSISIIFFVIGITGIFFSLFTILRPNTNQTLFSVSRCGGGRRVQDTFRNFYPITAKNRKLGDRDDGGIIERPKLLGFVGVQTGFGSIDRRASLRSTWFPSNHDSLIWLEQATGIAFRFVIGRSKDAKKMRDLEKEVEKYNDFLLIDVEEEYLRLPYKTLAFFKAAFDLFEADYYVKADDTVYLRPDRLATLLAKERPHPMTYIGCMKKGPVITDPKMKWYEKSGHLIGNEYFTHAYGPMYALSAEVVASLAAARNDSLRMFNNEDVTIGSWMLSMNVHHEDNRAICDPRCTPTSIAVWDIPKCSGLCNPSKKLKELHQMSMCSKSPTLPPEDR